MTNQSGRSLFGLLSAIARSGECMDCWAIDRKLRSLGFTSAEVSEALSDADDRAALLGLCRAARAPAREEQRMKDEAAFRQPIENI